MGGGMMKNEIKTLGKMIIKDLNLHNEYDVLNKWMIMYIAEQMHKYEIAASDEDKQIAGEKCTDAIMKFWKHRPYNSGWNPLEKYSELLEALNGMISNEYGVDIINFISSRSVDEGGLKEKTKIVRKVASWIVEDMFLKEFGEARDLEDDQWIDVIVNLGDGDAGVIGLLSDIADGHDRADNDYIRYRIEQIEKMIGWLNEFAHEERKKLFNCMIKT